MMERERGHIPQAISYQGHWIEGTHRLDEPVSSTTLKYWGGFPMDCM
jgi:hypothetical protein